MILKENDIIVECIYCGSTNNSKYGKTSTGNQRYLCNKCKRTYVLQVNHIKKYNIEHLECPRCHSLSVIKNGIKNSTQTYYCKKCSRHFRKPYTLTKKDKSIIFMYYFQYKVSIGDIAKHLKYPHDTVRKYIWECKRYMESQDYKKVIKRNKQELKVIQNRVEIMRRRETKWGN